MNNFLLHPLKSSVKKSSVLSWSVYNNRRGFRRARHFSSKFVSRTNFLLLCRVIRLLNPGGSTATSNALTTPACTAA
jgi:hypothetical protein